MTENSVIEKLKQLDAYPKTLADYRIKTYSGGAVTIVSYVIMVLLFLSELDTYLTTEMTEELFVDTTRTPKLAINIDFTFHHIPCKLLSLDAMDTSGDQHLQINHNVFKTSLDENGNPVAGPLKEDVGAVKLKNDTEPSAVAIPKCGSCYGAEQPHLNITCCTTCSDVREAYMKKRWAFPDPDTIEQCKDEGLSGSEIPKEGCNIRGNMEVNRVGGSFHIAPGQSFSVSHVHVHQLQPYSLSSFNSSHVINHLSFGDNIPGKTNPIDGTAGIDMEGATMFQYYVKIVPMAVSYQNTDKVIMSNQFSVTRHIKTEVRGSSPPGIFFNYELAPIMVKYTVKRRSFGHFATNVCAIIGGVFTVASIIDSVVYKSVQAFQKKIELGKGF